MSEDLMIFLILPTLAEEYVSMYTKYWDVRRDGEKEGIRKGRMEGIKSTTKNLLDKGLSVDKIMQATGLSKDEIETL